MAFRCINAFVFGDRIVAGGALVDDGDPILSTHLKHFAEVQSAPAPSGEAASTDQPRATAKAESVPAETVKESPPKARAARRRPTKQSVTEDLDVE